MGHFIILCLFVCALASHQVMCQDGDKLTAEGNGQQRTIYSQRHLSPHRMMHFGKRPSNPAPPTILTPQVYDPYIALPQQLKQQQQQPLQQQLWRPSLYLQQPDSPFLFTIELEQGRTIQALPEELSPYEPMQPMRDSLYNFERAQAEPFGYNLAGAAEQSAALRQAASGKHKLMKLLDGGNNDVSDTELENNLTNAERAQSSANGQEDGGQHQAQQQQQQPAINISTRSMQNGRPNSINLPKSYISSLLYGRQGSSSSSMPHYSGFNKKAEPKDNFFMHFGRK